MGKKKTMLLITSAEVVEVGVNKDNFSVKRRVQGVEYYDGEKLAVVGFSKNAMKKMGQVHKSLEFLREKGSLFYNKMCKAEQKAHESEVLRARVNKELGIIKKLTFVERVLFVFFPGKIDVYVSKKIALENG